jgi:hypothetical protein
MAGSWWRLLAAFLLILLAALLRGQDAGADRTATAPTNPELLRYAPSIEAGSASPFPEPADALPIAGFPLGHYPRAPGLPGFLQIARPAGIIFSGTVTAVSRASTKGRAAMAITFIRGVSAGQNLTIHEWAGLWNRGESYRVGERVFLFLYNPSRLGLTSPVAGGMGRFTVNSAGKILLTTPHIHLFATDPILGGKTILSYGDFAHALQRAGLE